MIELGRYIRDVEVIPIPIKVHHVISGDVIWQVVTQWSEVSFRITYIGLPFPFLAPLSLVAVPPVLRDPSCHEDLQDLKNCILEVRTCLPSPNIITT